MALPEDEVAALQGFDGNAHGGLLVTVADMVMGLGSGHATRIRWPHPTVSMSTEFVRGALMDWPNEPWILGGYSYTPVGAGAAREELAEPLSTLFFAGEATSINGHVGTVHGAIESGWRAAAEVLSSAG